MAPSEYLTLADRKFACGEYREAAGLMWKATEAVFVDLADSHGLDKSELILVARALAKDGSVAKYDYRGSLTVGNVLRDHAEMDVLETCELELAYELAQDFIDAMLAIYERDE